MKRFCTFAIMATLLATLSEVRAAEIREAPSALCFLSYRNKQSEEVRCSATLVTKSVLITASHCFPSAVSQIVSRITIGCGLLSQRTGGSGFSFSEEFYADGVILGSDDSLSLGTDFAFVHLNRPAMRETPMRLPGNSKDFQSKFMSPSQVSPGNLEMKASIECRSSGFGLDPIKKESYFQTSDQSPSNGLRALQGMTPETDSNLLIRSWGSQISLFRHGDSGGAFYCRELPGSQWELVGIITSAFEYLNGEPTGKSLVVATSSGAFLKAYRQTLSRWN